MPSKEVSREHNSSGNKRWITLDPELDLQHAAFMSYALHKVYELVESITRELNVVEFWHFTQKMRLDLRNTLDPELDLQHTVFMSYALHKVTSREHNS